jgi:hypothetical protein
VSKKWQHLERHMLLLAENREEDFLEIGQSETRIACGGHVC